MINIPWAIPNIQQEDIDYVKKVLESGWYSTGKEVKHLEDSLATYTNRRFAVATNNGTSALIIALQALEIRKGDEVIVPAMSYISTATSVSLVGATPIFVDIDKFLTIDTDEIEEKITSNTKAIIPVDLTGSPCDYSVLQEISETYDIPLIVDGAQSLGSTYKNKQCLSYGTLSTTSFHAAKVLTTIEGGMVFTNYEWLADKLRALRNQGETSTYHHQYLGSNYRMTDIHAAFANKQLERLPETLIYRTDLVRAYRDYFKTKMSDFNIREKGKSGNFAFLIFSNYRTELKTYLSKHNIDTREFFPMAIPRQAIYNNTDSFPLADLVCETSLALPLYASLTTDEIRFICSTIEKFYPDKEMKNETNTRSCCSGSKSKRT